MASGKTRFDETSGKRYPALWVALIIFLAIGIVATLYFVLKRKPAQTQPIAVKGKGDAGLIIAQLTTGTDPEETRRRENEEAYKKSLGVDPGQAALRNQAPMPDERKPKPVGDIARLLAEQSEKAELNKRLTDEGLMSSDPDALTDAAKRGASATGASRPTSSSAQKASPTGTYQPLSMRRRIQDQSGGKQKSPGSDGKGGTPESTLFDPAKPPPDESGDPEGTSADHGARRRSRTFEASAFMSVNTLPADILEIPAILMRNVVATLGGSSGGGGMGGAMQAISSAASGAAEGAGSSGYTGGQSAGVMASTNQRVVAFVEQDVYFRNRLQLPRGCLFVGSPGSVSNLSSVDITFDAIVFPDGSRVSVQAEAYNPHNPEYPEIYGVKGLVGQYVEPPLWAQFAPVILSAASGYAQSNISKVGSVNLQGGGSYNIDTTNKDRLASAGQSAANKLHEILMNDIGRYQPYVILRRGQPLNIVLKGDVDLTARTYMGTRNPLLPTPDTGEEMPLHPGGPADNPLGGGPPVDGSALKGVIDQMTPGQQEQALNFIKGQENAKNQ